MNDQAAETPMSDHIARFWDLLQTERVHVIVNIERCHDEGTEPHWDVSTFGDEVMKAIAADHFRGERK